MDLMRYLLLNTSLPMRFNIYRDKQSSYVPSNSTIVNALYPAFSSFFLPPRSGRSTTKQHSTISPPSFFTRLHAASIVHPVASKSSTIKTLLHFFMASLCISIVSVQYSSAYSSATTSAGSFHFFLTGTNHIQSLSARTAPTINHLDSIPTIASTSIHSYLSCRISVTYWNHSASLSRVVMSLNMMPSFGRFGTVLILDFIFSFFSSTLIMLFLAMRLKSRKSLCLHSV